MTNIHQLTAHNKMTVGEALEQCRRENFQDVMILAYNQDVELFIRSSVMTKQEALFMVMKTQEHIMGW